MNPTGAPDPLYVASRRVLLDALTALKAHHESLVLVGAQAVYIHAGEADLGVAPFTTDGDLALDPRSLSPDPLLEVALAQSGFVATDEVGIWETTVSLGDAPIQISIDLLVPESLGGGGRRGARIPPHDKYAARKVGGLEGTLVDKKRHTIGSLDTQDTRQFDLAVAGPAALIVAKIHKVLDREQARDRLNDKDALDILRLLRAVPTAELAARFRKMLADDLSRSVAQRAIDEMPQRFGVSRGIGVQMAVRSTATSEAAKIVATSMTTLVTDLIKELRK